MLANLDLAWKALSASPILTDLVSRLRESDSGSDTIPSPSREAALRAIDHLTRWSGAWEYFANTP